MTARMIAFPPLCEGKPVDMGDGTLIDGVMDEQHQWAEGTSYSAPNPVDGNPATWEPLVCERCGAITIGWKPITPPGGGWT